MPERQIRQVRQIRVACLSDAEALSGLSWAAFSGDRSAEYWRQQLDEGLTQVLVAEQPIGNIVGFVQTRRVVDEAEVLGLTSAHTHRRQGIARDLMRHVIADLRSDPPCRLFLEVSIENTAAIALYRSLGFQDAGYRKNYYDQPDRAPVDAQILVLAIIG